jgi:hypothetical protein
MSVPAKAQQDPQELLGQLTALMQQMQGASDPCPYMPKLKSLINQVAQQSPEVYQAMKPSLDLMAQDDGCAGQTSAVPPAQPLATGSGTAPPPNCVDLGNGRCVTPAEYRQMQAQQGNFPTQVCPSSGFIPGPGHYAACDAYIGERYFCTPGQRVRVYSPAPPPASCGGGGSNNGNSNGPVAHGPDGPSEVACIDRSKDAYGHPIFYNHCPFAVRYYWTPLNPAPGDYKAFNGDLGPGETNTGAVALGEYRMYACQEGGPDGRVITQYVSGFRCVKAGN